MPGLANRPVFFALLASLGLHVLLLGHVGNHGMRRAAVAPSMEARVGPMSIRTTTPQAVQHKVAIKENSIDSSKKEESSESASPTPVPAPTETGNETDNSIVSASERRSWLPFLQTYYFKTDALTERPVYLRDIAPQASAVVPDFDPQPVVATLLINELGRVDEVILSESVLSQQAQLLVSNWFANIEFTPGMIGKMPVKTQMTIEVRLDAILTLQ